MTTQVRSDRRMALLVAGTAALVLLLGVPFGVPFSAGSAGALAILDGGWPYRDFWTLYAPGHFWLTAALFGVFGSKLIVAAIAAVVLEAAACGLFFRLLRRLAVPRAIAGTAALVVAGVLFKAGPTLSTYAPVVVSALAGWTRVVDAVGARDGRNAFLGGMWIGAAAWFKHDVAGYVGIAALAGLIGAWLLRREPRESSEPHARRGTSGSLQFVLGAAASALPVAVLVAITGGRDAWEDLVVFPLTQFPLARPEHYPGWSDVVGAIGGDAGDGGVAASVSKFLKWLRHWVPVATWVVLFVVLFRRRRAMPEARLVTAIAALVALPCFFMAAHVQINTHILSMSAITVGAVAVAWSGRRGALGRRVGLALGTVVLLAALAEEPARSLARAIDVARHGRRLDAREVPGAAGLVVAAREADEIEGAARRVRELTSPGEPIYVGVARHDAVVISRPELYALFGRANATRYAELHPGVVDREEVQREIASDLDRRGVRVLVLWHVGWPRSRFDEIRARRQEVLPGTGSPWLDQWIAEHFETAGTSGELEVLVRRSSP